jgi:DNA-binding PadR family transcriptional regulator
MALNKNLISGSTTLLILRLLEEKDLYGYEMIELLRQRSKNVFELKAGTLYPLLHSLEVKGFLTSYESEANGKMRKYYQITKSGRRFLREQKEEWQTYAQAVANVLNTGMQAAASRFIVTKVRR